MPVAADIAVGIVIEAHMLHSLDGLELAHHALVDQPLDLLIEHGVAEHMAHKHGAAQLLGTVGDHHDIFQLVGNRLLQHQVVAQLHSLQSMLLVLGILGGDDHIVSHLGLCQNGIGAVKQTILGQMQILIGSIQTDPAVVGHCHNFHLLRVLQLLACIGSATVAHATDRKCHFFHDISSYVMVFRIFLRVS